MKILLFIVFLMSALACAYFMVVFLRELKKAIAKQEPPPIGILIMAFLFVIIMLLEASAAVGIMLKL